MMMTPGIAERLTFEYNAWAEELYNPSGIYDFNIVEGGRGSSKTPNSQGGAAAVFVVAL